MKLFLLLITTTALVAEENRTKYDVDYPGGDWSGGEKRDAVDLYGPVLWFEQRDLAMFRKTRTEAPEHCKQADSRTHIDKSDPPLR